MNQIMKAYYPTFEMYQALRGKLMALLEDEDLTYAPGGSNMALGKLCLEMGEVQVTYIESLRTFKHDMGFRRDLDPELAGSATAMRAWYEALDKEMKDVVAGLSDDDIDKRSE